MTRVRGLHWAAVLLLVLLVPMACAQAPDGNSTERTAAAMPEPLQTPPGFFPILPWDSFRGSSAAVDMEKLLAGVAECNFTIAGFVKPADLPICEALGLKAIVYGTADRGPLRRDEWKRLSEEEIDAFFKQAVADAGASEAVLGYYLIDEPGAALFPKLAAGVAAVRKYAPGKLAYINLFPGYATIGAPDTSQLEAASFDEYLERFVIEVKPQFVSYDDYMVQYSMDLAEAGRASRYFVDLMAVRSAALRHGLPFWNIVSSNQIRAHTTIPSPANLALQAYTTLAAGGRGVSWYTYTARGYGYAPISKEGHRTATWQYLQSVNRQLRTLGPIMNGLRSTGVYFTSPAPMDAAPVLPGKVVAAVQSDTPAMVGEFVAADDTRYAMIVNLSLQKSVRASFSLQQGHQTGTVISPEDGSELPLEDGNVLWLTAGQGALVKLR